MVTAFEPRAMEYTVFFIVSVGRRQLLSACVKLGFELSAEAIHAPSFLEIMAVAMARNADSRTRDLP